MGEGGAQAAHADDAALAAAPARRGVLRRPGRLPRGGARPGGGGREARPRAPAGAAPPESRGVRQRGPRPPGARGRRRGSAASGRRQLRVRQHRRRAARVPGTAGRLPRRGAHRRDPRGRRSEHGRRADRAPDASGPDPGPAPRRIAVRHARRRADRALLPGRRGVRHPGAPAAELHRRAHHGAHRAARDRDRGRWRTDRALHGRRAPRCAGGPGRRCGGAPEAHLRRPRGRRRAPRTRVAPGGAARDRRQLPRSAGSAGRGRAAPVPAQLRHPRGGDRGAAARRHGDDHRTAQSVRRRDAVPGAHLHLPSREPGGTSRPARGASSRSWPGARIAARSRGPRSRRCSTSSRPGAATAASRPACASVSSGS